MEEMDVDGRIWNRFLKKIYWDGVGWIELVKLKEKWRAVVNTVTNLP